MVRRLIRSIMIGVWGLSGGWFVNTTKLYAQTPICQPPQAGEFLLFVRPRGAEDQQKLVSILPENISISECQYLGNTVLRIGGFESLEKVTSWGRYAIEIGGLEAIAIQPGTGTSQTFPVYNPQPLGSGFAVLVDYFNRPEFANQLQQALETPVGLASFGQRPFLLALHTTNQEEAKALLKSLSDRGFSTLIVNSRQVMLLRSQVQL